MSDIRLDDDRDIALGDAISWLAPDQADRAARFRFQHDRAGLAFNLSHSAGKGPKDGR